MKPKAVFNDAAKGLVIAVVFFAAVEALVKLAYSVRNRLVTYIPLVYATGDQYIVPPWLEGFRLLEEDKTFIWKNRPNVRRRYVDVYSPSRTEEERRSLERRFLPRLPDSLRRNPKWEISTNSEGFRTAEFAKVKPPGTFRIVCLGDSWTFGSNVDQNKAYPQQLTALLARNFPRANFEVLNLGVMGYSSYQGLELLKRQVLDLYPDLVLIGFAMNDSHVSGYRDKDMQGYKESRTAAARAVRLVQKSEIYKLLNYLTRSLMEKPKSIGEQLKASTTTGRGGDILDMPEGRSYEQFEAWTRVPLIDYEKNIVEMIKLARERGASVVLLFNELWRNNPYRIALEKISAAQRVPLVDSSALIAENRRRIEEELEKKLGRVPDKPSARFGNNEVEVVFRVYSEAYPVPETMYIVGNHSKLGNLVPNKIRMYDDGTHGDQSAGDRIWSYAATFPSGTDVFYIYTNSGREGKWEGLDLPAIRGFKVAGMKERTIYRPIESFGKLPMQADNWHTNAEGYDLIANALLRTLKRDPKVNDYLRGIDPLR
ncbi:MAG: GDSL-type esterase/lipase family protein [Candidatus Binatia bacterium]